MGKVRASRPGSASSAPGSVVLWREKIDTVTPSSNTWLVLSQCPTRKRLPAFPGGMTKPLRSLRDPGAPSEAGVRPQCHPRGIRPGPDDGCGDPADLRDQHLQAGR